MNQNPFADPARMLAAGHEVLAAQPFSRLLGAELVTFEPGAAELRLPLRPDLRQQFGVVHGGVVSYLADNTLTFAGGSVLGTSVLTAEYKISYLEPATGAALVARGSVLHASSRQAVCRCDVFDIVADRESERESLCATALGTIRSIPQPSADEST